MVMHVLSGPKMFFCPAGATHYSDKREISQKNYVYGEAVREYCQNFEFCPQIRPSGATRLHNFHEILSVCTRP